MKLTSHCFPRHALSLAVPQLQTSVRVTSIPKSLHLICGPSEYDLTNECPQRRKGRGFLYATKATDREPLSLTDLPSWRRRNVIGQFQTDKRNEHGFSRWASNELAFIVPPLKSSLHVWSSKFKDYKFLRSETTKPSCYFFFFQASPNPARAPTWHANSLLYSAGGARCNSALTHFWTMGWYVF